MVDESFDLVGFDQLGHLKGSRADFERDFGFGEGEGDFGAAAGDGEFDALGDVVGDAGLAFDVGGAESGEDCANGEGTFGI